MYKQKCRTKNVKTILKAMIDMDIMNYTTLGNMLHVSDATIRGWMSGVRPVHYEDLIRIEEKLGINLDYDSMIDAKKPNYYYL